MQKASGAEWAGKMDKQREGLQKMGKNGKRAQQKGRNRQKRGPAAKDKIGRSVWKKVLKS